MTLTPFSADPVFRTYDRDGNALWFIMNGGQWTSPGTFAGKLIKGTGSPLLNSVYDAARFTPIEAGTITIEFFGTANATATTVVDSVRQLLPITRMVF